MQIDIAVPRDAVLANLRALVGRISKYHDEKAPKGRTFRFHVGAYPRPTDAEQTSQSPPE